MVEKEVPWSLFGSETGNAQDAAEEVGHICERLHFATHVYELNSIDIRRLLHHTVVIFVISTTGQGELPANSQSFWRSLRSVRLPQGWLKKVRFASFGIGDSSYPKFNWAHRKLYNRVVQLGGQPVCNRGESDEQHPEGIDGTFVPWSIDLRKRLLEEFPLPDGTEPIPDDVLIQPKWSLEFEEATDSMPGTGVSDQTTSSMDESTTPSTDLIPIPGCLTATIQSSSRLTPESHYQDTRHVVLTLPGTNPYPPGATLTIYPKNFPSDVSEFLERMSWTHMADTPLKFVPSDPRAGLQNYPPTPIPDLPSEYKLTLRTLLANHLDIMSIPRRSLFSHFMHYTTNELHLERLQEFTSADLIDELYDYTTRPRRSILEVLSDFDSVRLPWQNVCSIIPKMRGRQFSIASGGSLKLSTTISSSQGTQVDLLIAIVKYRTIIRRIRHGVATRYISTFQPGQTISVTLQQGSLGIKQSEIHRPVVMISPGTGVAPMRSLAWERRGWREELGLPLISAEYGKDILFFGCRQKGMDEYFHDEWEGLQVEACVAYSREQREKVYVQDLIRQRSKRVFEALAEREGLVFVCGSSGKMPQAVREALIEVFQKEGVMTRSDAEEYLAKMEKDGRYKQETW